MQSQAAAFGAAVAAALVQQLGLPASEDLTVTARAAAVTDTTADCNISMVRRLADPQD